MKQLLAVGFTLTLGLTEVALAAEPGTAAPPLNLSAWVKGKPVDLAAGRGTKIFVVEFWGTYCPPCLVSIPHLTAMQKKFKDVVVIGISDEDLSVVRQFVNRMGDKMDYTVGVDEGGKTISTYMAEFLPRPVIPYACIVDKQGVVVWAGSPLPGAGMEEVLVDVVAGKLTGELARRREIGKQKLNAFLELAAAREDDPKLESLGRELEALDAELGGIQAGKKFSAPEARHRVKFDRLKQDYFMAVMAGNSSTNLDRLAQKLGEAAPKDFDLADFKAVAMLNKDFNEYLRAATGSGDTNRIPELTRRLAGTTTKNFAPLLQVAWKIVIGESLQPRDLDLAATLAKRAVDLSGGKNIDALFVYGRTLLEAGKVGEAIAWQKQAIAVAGDDAPMRQQLETTLEQYQAKLARK